MNESLLEQKLLEVFKKKFGKEVEGLDLMVSIPDPDTWEEEHTCLIMETKDCGRVWEVYFTRTGNNIKDWYEL